ncbi:MAG: hypothetical protein JSW40_02075 [Candidatus Omnitrophota bacterium]|nr:MAG: hypothetical protein JSW40_02075 [Candidatus Omnitrophota bacterium]
MKAAIKFVCKFSFVSFIALFFSVCAFSQEELTITTYYPAPYGVYKELRSQRMAIGDNYIDTSQYCWEGACKTPINPDADLVLQGNVGIGTINPQATLDVSGGVRVGSVAGCGAGGCTADNAGTLRYCSNELQHCDGTTDTWKPIGGSFDVYDSGWQAVEASGAYTIDVNITNYIDKFPINYTVYFKSYSEPNIMLKLSGNDETTVKYGDDKTANYGARVYYKKISDTQGNFIVHTERTVIAPIYSASLLGDQYKCQYSYSYTKGYYKIVALFR